MHTLSRTGSPLGLAARVAIASGLVALAAGLMPGCIVVADGTRTVVLSEPAVAQDKLDRIALGATTEEELRSLLGPPSERSLDGDTQTWTYRGIAPSSGRTVVYIDEDDDEIRTSTRHARVTVELTGGVVTAVRRE